MTTQPTRLEVRANMQPTDEQLENLWWYTQVGDASMKEFVRRFRELLSASKPAAPTDDVIDLAVALEQQRALHIVAAVRQHGFSKSETPIPTQAESVFDLACEEIEHRLRTEVWELDGVDLPLPAAPAQSVNPVAGEIEAFKAWFKTSGFWNDAITEKAWRAACAWMRETNAAACEAIVGQSKNSLFRSGAKICAGHIRDGAPEQCDAPPDGWVCSRPKGHTGPCAATQAAVVLDDERAALTSNQFAAIRAGAAALEKIGGYAVFGPVLQAMLDSSRAASPQEKE